MPRIVYVPRKFSDGSLDLIARANAILDEYEAQGFDLTLRQLYYQFVSRGWLANRDREYKRLGSVVNDARMAGHIDWDRIVDRTRELVELSHWRSPAAIVKASAEQYRRDLWATQPRRVEVWIEKDALIGVIEGVCEELDVPYFSCRGYTSQSEMWGAAQRLGAYVQREQRVTILHLGDHDPSGIDMTRDIDDRLHRFLVQDHFNDSEGIEPFEAVEWISEHFEVRRIALTMDQIELYDPPPNPAKLTDSRGADYVDLYGNESWELDALEPTVMAQLIGDEVRALLDADLWEDAVARQDEEQQTLLAVSSQWTEIVEGLS